MKLLVACVDYPDLQGAVSMKFVHIRNLYYKEQGIEVTVLNFSGKNNYQLDGIPVITYKEYQEKRNSYDLLVCHAANIRNHYRFLKKYGKNFSRIVFFYHGHEVLPINKVYPKPYAFVKQNIGKTVLQNIYDRLKLIIWRKYLKKTNDKNYYVFVSKWMYHEFTKWVGSGFLKDRYMITYNCVGKVFETASYEESEKFYDFITIRSNLDGSKYGVDIVNELALRNPDCKFLLIGKGTYFEYYEKAKNIELRQETLSHAEIIQALNMAKCALMPTRTDSQGLMTCEMATFGIPVITSDIPVCREVLEGFPNVGFISNSKWMDNLKEYSDTLTKKVSVQKNTKYFNKNTSQKEVELFQRLAGGDNKRK